MYTVARRQILLSLGSILPGALLSNRARANFARAVGNGSDPDDLPYGCVFAKKVGSRLGCLEESLHEISIDLWTFRFSEIDPSNLPANIGHVVVWDDVFSKRLLKDQVLEILKAIPKFYGFDPIDRSSAYRIHLDGFSEIKDVIGTLLKDPRSGSVSQRVAFIDIESCGVSRLDWPNILPAIRDHYDLIVGFSHAPGRRLGDWRRNFDEYEVGSSSLSAMAHCDLTFLTSDGLLGFDERLDCDVRQPHLNCLVVALLRALCSRDFIGAVASVPGVSSFGIGAALQSPTGKLTSGLIEHQRRIMMDDFCSNEVPLVFEDDSSPLILHSLALWPLAPISGEGKPSHVST